jgi:cytochrome b pre-mRNA-processing protein 3
MFPHIGQPTASLLPQPGHCGKLMIFNRFFRKRAVSARNIYEAIVAAARHPVPYAHWDVADDIDGRFDMIGLHMFLALDRLKGEEGPFRQQLVDEFFTDMDRSLREMGVGDVSVGKKVRKMAEAFYGRVGAYEGALKMGKDAMAAALARNFFPEGDHNSEAAKFADYVLATRMHLARIPTGKILAGDIDFAEPKP